MGVFFRAGRRDAAARVAARRRRRREAERHARRRDVLVVRRERQLAQDEYVARAAPDEQRARVVGGAAAPRGQEPELLAGPVALLPYTHFPTGHGNPPLRPSVAMVHANWVRGHDAKVKRLRSHKLWRDGACADFQ